MKRRLKLLEGSDRTRDAGGVPPRDGGGAGERAPDGFSLHFDRGRALLRLQGQRLSDLAELEILEMSIPNLTFPFDVTGGIRGLRRRRLSLHRLRVSVRVSDLVEAAAARAASSPWIGSLRAATSEDAMTVLVDFGPETHRVPLSFRLVPVQGAQEVAFAVEEARCYGPLPGPLVGAPFAVLGALDWISIRGAIVRFKDPVKSALLALLPARGWRLPDCSAAVLARIEISPSRVAVEFRSRDCADDLAGPFPGADLEGLKRAEERRVLGDGDGLLAEGALQEARAVYSRLAGHESLGPAAVARLASLDVAEPGLCAAARSLVADARLGSPRRTDLAAVAAHGAAVAEDRDAEAEALEVLFEASNELERYAAGMRLGELLADRDPERAARRFEEALAVRREDPGALEALIAISGRLGSRELFDRLVHRWIAVHREPPQRARAHAVVGRILLERFDDAREAARHFERASLADPGSRDAALGLARALQRLGDTRRAVALLDGVEKSARRARDHGAAREALAAIGEIWLAAGEPALAVARFREVLELGAPAPALRVRLAEALESTGHFAEAAVELEAALRASEPGSGALPWEETALALARLLFERVHDATAAEAWARRAARKPGLEPSARALLLEIYAKLGRSRELIALHERVAADDPTAEHVLALAKARLELGDAVAAVGELQAARRKHPDRADVVEALVAACRAAGDRERLRRALADAWHLERDPKRRAEYACEIGSGELKGHGDLAQAVEWLERGVDDAPELIDARADLVRALELLGRKEELVDQLAAVGGLYARSGQRAEAALASLRRSEILEGLGKRDLAAAALRDALPDLPGEKRGGALLALGRWCAETGDHAGARHFFSAARAELGGADDGGAALGEAEAAFALGDAEAALAAATVAGSGSSALRPRAAAIASRSALRLGRPVEAVRILERVAENAEDGDAERLLVDAARVTAEALGDAVRSRAILEAAAERLPGSNAVREALLAVLERGGDRAALARALVRYSERSDDRAAELRRAADYFLAEGLREEAVEALREAFEANRDAETGGMLADALWNGGDPDGCIAVLRAVADRDESARALLAARLESARRFGDLVGLLGSHREVEPARESARLERLARILREGLGRPREATPHLLAAAELEADGEGKRRLVDAALASAREAGDGPAVRECVERRAALAIAGESGRWQLLLAGARWEASDVAGAREAIRAGLKEEPRGLDALRDAVETFPACTPLALATAERAAGEGAWQLAEAMLSNAIARTSGEERTKLCRQRAAIRRSRLGDDAGAMSDLLEARDGGGLSTAEKEELIGLLEAGGRLGAAAEIAAELASDPATDGKRLERAARLAAAAGEKAKARDLWRRVAQKSREIGAVIELVKLLDPVADRSELKERLAALSGKEEFLDLPDHLGVLESRVRLDLAEGREEDAIADLTAALQVAPQAADPWQNLVRLLERRGEWEALAARMEERLTLAVAPADVVQTGLALGAIYDEKLGDEGAALAALERVRAVDPKNEAANTALAGLAFRRQRFADLERYLEPLSQGEWREDVALWRAKIHEQKGDVDRAREELLEIVRRDPKSAAGIEGFFRLASSATHDDSVLEIGARLAETGAMESVRPSVLRRLGHAHLRRGDVDAALEKLERADRISDGDVETLRLLAEARAAKGDHLAAADDLCRMAFRFEGEKRAASLVAAARTYLQHSGDSTRARQWLKSAEEAAPRNADVLLGLADCAAAAGDHTAVAQYLERYGLVAPERPLDASRVYKFAVALTRTRAWPPEDIAEMLERVIGDLPPRERGAAEHLVALLRRGG
jgi:tetratricopeptide (TPR) repeat protein